MKIFKVSSGSDGNAYIVKSETTGRMVILDCGVPLRKIVMHKEFSRFADIDFVWVSHLHNDHYKYVHEFEQNGVNIKYGLGKPFSIGEWACIEVPIVHNIPNFALVLWSRNDKEKLCYATDFSDMPLITGVQKWIYEINHDLDLVQHSMTIDDGRDATYLISVTQNHNSLQNAITYFSQLQLIDGYKPTEIKCCHLSKNNIQKNRIKKEMSKFCDNIEIY